MEFWIQHIPGRFKPKLCWISSSFCYSTVTLIYCIYWLLAYFHHFFRLFDTDSTIFALKMFLPQLSISICSTKSGLSIEHFNRNDLFPYLFEVGMWNWYISIESKFDYRMHSNLLIFDSNVFLKSISKFTIPIFENKTKKIYQIFQSTLVVHIPP